jgi:hypothetical protein
LLFSATCYFKQKFEEKKFRHSGEVSKCLLRSGFIKYQKQSPFISTSQSKFKETG